LIKIERESLFSLLLTVREERAVQQVRKLGFSCRVEQVGAEPPQEYYSRSPGRRVLWVDLCESESCVVLYTSRTQRRSDGLRQILQECSEGNGAC